MDSRSQANQELWDRWTEDHETSSFYDVASFRDGASTLKSFELDAMGPVDGLSLLHLQCHFGLDSLSWARRGAQVLGVDFSSKAIDLARSLAAELSIPAEFVQADVLDLPFALAERRFDRVFTSYGVLWWLADLDAWARTIERALVPGGRFVIVEFHPITSALSEDGAAWELPYFASGEPVRIAASEGYVEPGARSEAAEPLVEIGWPHSLGEVLSSLLATGLSLERFEEHPHSPYPLPGLVEVGPEGFAYPGLEGKVPMVFSLVMKKP